jgi:hypothetical protein
MTAIDEAALLRLGHLNHLDFVREMSRVSGPQGAIVEEGGVLLFASGSTFPVTFNGAVRVDPQVPGDQVVARADAWFDDRARGYTLMTSDQPGVDDTDLVTAALEAGLHDLTRTPQMVCRAALDEWPPPSGVELRWLTDVDGVADFVAVSSAAYASLGLPAGEIEAAIVEPQRLLEPHVHSVVAYLGGAPVGAAQTLLSHGMAGVFWVGTVESARGLGLGDAVTRAVTNRAFDLGAAAVTLQASPMGEPVYLRMGYETLFHYRGLVRFV